MRASSEKKTEIMNKYQPLERFRNRQTTITNTCGWAVFLHVEFRFRDGDTDKTNTNTTSSAEWNLQ